MQKKGELLVCEMDKLEIRQCVDLYLDFCRYEKRLSNQTLKAYKQDLDQYLEMYDGQDMINCVRQYVSFVSKQYEKPRTIKRKIATLKAFFTYLVQMEILEYNPFNKVYVNIKEPKELVRIIPEEDLKKLFNYLTIHFEEELTITTIIHLLLATGMRVSELTSLRVQNIHLEDSYVKILGKGKKERIVYLGNEETIGLLRYYYSMYKEEIEDKGYFFINAQGNPISADSIRRKLKKISVDIKATTSITPHMFRHTFATKLLDDGVDSFHIKNILGHSSIATTEKYAKSTTKKQKEILSMYNPTKEYSVFKKAQKNKR